MKSKQFPKHFKWGVTISSYQNEGAYNTHGKGPSIWDTFTNRRTFKKGNGNTATDFYSNYKEDIAHVKALNLDCFRFSLSWSRIFPDGEGKINPEGVQFYHHVIDHALEHNLEPWITLYHWDLPQALQNKGGWVNREILNWFESYVEFCTKEYGHKVNTWIILNEPMSFIGLGYYMGIHAPGKKGISNFLPASHHAALCQSLGGRIVRKNVENAVIGTTFSCSYVRPFNRRVMHKHAAVRIDALLNRFFIEPALGMGYPLDAFAGLNFMSKYMKPGDEDMLPFDFDFIGVQYYFKVVAKFSLLPPILFATEVPADKRNVKLNAMNLEIYPKGLYKMLEKFNAYPGVKAIYITESGVCFEDELIDGKINDKQRISYFKKTFKYTFKAIENNMPIKGYFIWTLVDNFEWAEGTKPRFGIIHTNFNTQKRTIKKSGLWIKRFLSKRNTK
ncbi:family 1 glycosylhydrolase [Formosa sediminum]|uniref:Family 1 glycosylhydrolase n=1 Tax=Formosa sediminum TaxID=2594004 RepID=A0A516GT57_9FLAO|nr:family 1 glycosylhydrolase [Formosa sediminum]QDO94704.1 family 1 glycosylhydrolase [Formosa sediminum]